MNTRSARSYFFFELRPPKSTTIGSFPVPFLSFFGNLIYENLFKMTFYAIKCIKTCQREQVNKFSQPFLNAKSHVNNF